MSVQPLADPDVVVRAFKAEHNEWHGAWQRHVDRCSRCAFGGWCRTASMLADQADVAGRRWQEAERRARSDR